MEFIFTALYWLVAGFMLFGCFKCITMPADSVDDKYRDVFLGAICYAVMLAMVANGPSRFVQAVLR